MNKQMNKYVKTSLIIATIITVALLSAFLANTMESRTLPFEPRQRLPHNIRGDIELYYTVKTAVSTVNITILIILLFTYMDIYLKTKSEFTIGLIIFSTVLLLNALASNPLLIRLFGFRALGLGPFAMLPDLFTLVALSLLLYFTLKY